MDNKEHKKTLDYLMSAYGPLVSGTVRRMRDRYPHLQAADHGDLYEAAANGLMSAIHSHDPDKGASLSTYAAQKMGKAMLQKFQPKDISNQDLSAANRLRPQNSESKQSVQSMSTGKLDRGAIESAGGSVSEEGGASGVSVIRNEAADFARKNPHMISELQRKTGNYEKAQAAKAPAPTEAPVPVKAPAPPPPIIIRRKQVEASLQPEQVDRMSRIDSKKGPI